MNETQIKSFSEFHNVIETYARDRVIYRGVKSTEYDLTPKIGRLYRVKKGKVKTQDEIHCLEIFKRQALPFLNGNYSV